MISKEDILKQCSEGTDLERDFIHSEKAVLKAMDKYFNEGVDACIEVVNGLIVDTMGAKTYLLNSVIKKLEQLKKPIQ